MLFSNLINKKRWLFGCLAAVGAILAGQGQASALDLLSVDHIFGSHSDACGDTCGDDGCCDTGCGSDSCLGGCFGGDDSGTDIGGWVEYGWRSNTNPLGPNNGGDLNFNDTFGASGDQGFNQIWLYAEKAADGSDGIGLGYRVDLMYGLDADDTQAFGNPEGSWDYVNGFDHGIYGWALPQLYGEVAMGDLSVIAGHFYTLVGYEVVTAPDNFFYSHAYTMFNNEPFTHTGVLATYSASDNTTLYGGWVAGWDTGFDQLNDGSQFIGGASVGLGDNVTATYIMLAGNSGLRAGGGGKGYNHSIVLDVTLTEKMNYVFQSDLVDYQNAGINDNQYSINQYLFYTVSDQVALGGRVEWWKTNNFFTNPNSIYEITGGVNVKPFLQTDSCGNTTGDNFIVRPEYRYNWSNNLFSYGTFNIDAIVTF